MDDINYINNIRTLILTNKKPSYQTTNKKEVRIRCPYCGDSKKDLSSAHLYIAMTPPFKFHCFKCETSGVLNSQTLRDMGIINNDLSLSVIQANKNLKNGTAKIITKKKSLIFSGQTVTDQLIENTNYFNSRYQVNLAPEYICEKFKVVLNANDFFNNNHIAIPPYVNKQYNLEKTIGFASSDNTHVVFRDTSGLQKTRYFNLNLFQSDNGNKFYNISNNIDIMAPTVNLVMTEGIFDIIGVYLHYYKDTEKEQNTIFAAACGKGYNAVIAHYVRMGFLNLNVIIYSDADVPTEFFKEMMKDSPFLKNSRITVYYNSLYNPNTGSNKDFGIPKDQIQLRRVIL